MKRLFTFFVIFLFSNLAQATIDCEDYGQHKGFDPITVNADGELTYSCYKTSSAPSKVSQSASPQVVTSYVTHEELADAVKNVETSLQTKINDAVDTLKKEQKAAWKKRRAAKKAKRKNRRAAKKSKRIAKKKQVAAPEVKAVTETVFKDREIFITEKYAEKCNFVLGAQIAKRGGYLGVGCEMELFERTKETRL